jgi:glycerophosphoryl diester phosphodiesterase
MPPRAVALSIFMCVKLPPDAPAPRRPAKSAEQAHRGGRGNTVESTLPAFAWGMVNGARTLELDNGITKDGVVVVWHDEEITSEKCLDTAPATAGDPDWPYVGKFLANLTWAQLKTLDCGSKRPSSYRKWYFWFFRISC